MKIYSFCGIALLMLVSPGIIKASDEGRSSSLMESAGERLEYPIFVQGTEVWVDVRLNDRVTTRMLLDTGSSVVVLPARVVAALGLEDTGRSQPIQTLGGTVKGRWLTLDRVAVGAASVAQVAAVMVASGGDSASGLLGRSFLNNFRYTVDLDRKKLTLIPRRGGSGAAWRNVTPSTFVEEQLASLERELLRATLDASTTPEYLSQLKGRLAYLRHRRAELP